MMIQKVGVIGAGTMGNGIAQVCAAAGMSVTLVDISAQVLEKAMATMAQSLERLVRKEQLTEHQKGETLARVSTSTAMADLADVDLAIEAATEVLSIKESIIRQVDEVVRADAIIATNTSSISISRIAGVSRRPERCIGMHFFNPVPVMLLVELIAGLQTSEETRASVDEFISRINKTAVNVKNSPGFAVNRILVPMINEAIFVLQEGIASAEDIDNSMQLGCNHPIGPLALADLIGLDTLLMVMEVLHSSFGDSKYRPATMLREMVEARRLGKKVGQGFYSY
jgi:3-hydroxybutyryl-CoA dehydrogenase